MSYQDDATMTDPCSAYGIQKLSFSYWSFLELPPAYQGLQPLVFVSQIAWSKTLKVAGPCALFGGSHEDDPHRLAFGTQLQELNDGAWMETSSGRKVVHAHLVLHCADTPAANVYCGKMETLTNTKCFCRLCFAKQHQRLIPEGTVGFVSALAGLG